MGKTYCVYCHVSPSGKRYIGITCRKPEIRWNYGYGYIGNPYFTRAIKKYGWDSFQHIVICEGLSAEEASEMEIALIKEYNSTDSRKGYNISLGGINENQVFSDEIRKKISDAKRGIPCPIEKREHLSKLNKGKIPTNLDSLHKLNQKKVDQFDLSVDYITSFESIKIAARESGANVAAIGNCCNGRYKTAGGYIWKFSA